MAEADAIDAARQAMEVDNDQDKEMQDAGDNFQQFGGDNGPQGDLDIHTCDMDDCSNYGLPPSLDLGKDFMDVDTPPGTPAQVCTPLPSPPQTPPPNNNEPDDDFKHVTAEDYCKYNHWFREDEHELDEIIAEMLTEEEMDSIKMSAILLFGHISECNYEHIQFSFRNKIQFLLTYCTTQKLALLSGIKPQIVDCCDEVCLAFTGKYSEDTKCAKCGRPCYDEKN
ncbi:hypothetical protein FRC11_005446 [Ceratobasidium sp. 423]|nr:hypothetical protein FRC11_005446 [Ceratobasidium sp. 423]